MMFTVIGIVLPAQFAPTVFISAHSGHASIILDGMKRTFALHPLTLGTAFARCATKARLRLEITVHL